VSVSGKVATGMASCLLYSIFIDLGVRIVFFPIKVINIDFNYFFFNIKNHLNNLPLKGKKKYKNATFIYY